MSLSKIVGNLRSKLKDEERKNQSMSLKLEQLIKEKEQIKNKIDNMKREKKLGAPATKPAQTTSVPPKSKPITNELSQD